MSKRAWIIASVVSIVAAAASVKLVGDIANQGREAHLHEMVNVFGICLVHHIRTFGALLADHAAFLPGVRTSLRIAAAVAVAAAAASRRLRAQRT